MFRLPLPTAIVMSAGAAALLAGCAVTRIDVDVYKGPLANHEDVQVEQMAVTAIAAKEMLVDLRDLLEWGRPHVEWRRDRAIQAAWYKRGYVRDPRVGNPMAAFDERQWFENPDAVRVNHILSLYEDELDDTDSQLANYIADGLRALKDYEMAWATLIPDEEPSHPSFDRLVRDTLAKVLNQPTPLQRGWSPTDDARWERYQKTFYPQLNGKACGKTHPLVASLPVEQQEEAACQLERLVDAYRDFLAPGAGQYRRELAILDAHHELQRLISAEGDARRFGIARHGLSRWLNDRRLNRTHANERFEILRDQRLITSHAELLFPQEPKPEPGRETKAEAARREFLNHVQQVVEAYFASREAMARLFHAVMQITILHEVTDASPTATQHRRMTDAAAKFAADAVDPLALTFLIGAATGNENDPVLDTLRVRLLGVFDDLAEENGQPIERAATSARKIRDWIQQEFSKRPVQMATAILLADVRYRAMEKGPLAEAPRAIQGATGRAYGLVRGPHPLDLHLLLDRATKEDSRQQPSEPEFEIMTRQQLQLQRSVRDGRDKADEKQDEEKPLSVRAEMLFEDDFETQIQRNLAPILFATDLRELRGESIGPFAKGRLPQGLHGMIREYLEATHDHGPESDKARVARRRLVDGLVHFAEKLLFLANHDSLVSQKEATFPGIIPFSYGMFYRPLLGNEIIDRISASAQAADYDNRRSTERTPDAILTFEAIIPHPLPPDPRPYVRVLQATGNSILIHADELKIRDAHRDRGEDRAKIEFAALDQGQRGTARAVVDDLREVLDQRRGEANEAGQPGESGERARLQHAVEKLEEIDDQVVRHFAEERGLPTRQEVHLVIEGVLLERMAEVNDKERESWLDAIRVVRRHRPLDLEAIRGIPLREGETDRDVLDRLIAVLRNEHIQLVRQYGKESEPVRRVEAALESAHDHRSGMIYLRPAGAYLRSSFVATDLQDDPGLRWRNLLAGHGTRAIPFAPQIGDLFDRRRGRDAEIVAELDKQYWHPINQVRVAGGGNTNYVMAKDDIGNWYVKNYSADASEAYASAVNLLQYATGGGTFPGFTPPDAADPPAEDAGVRQLLNRHSGQFAARSAAQAEAARALVQDDDDGLARKITAVLESRFEDDEDFLEELERGRRVAEQRHLSDLRGEDDDPSGIHSDEAAVVVATAVAALTKTAQAWRAEIQKTGHDHKDAADDIVTGMTRDKLLTLVTQRRAAVAEFERAARVIGVTGD